METPLLEALVEAISAERGVDPTVVHAEALRLYMNSHPDLKLHAAVTLWQSGRISLAKAAEVAGLTVPELKEVLAARGIIRETEGKSAEEMDATLRERLR